MSDRVLQGNKFTKKLEVGLVEVVLYLLFVAVVFWIILAPYFMVVGLAKRKGQSAGLWFIATCFAWWLAIIVLSCMEDKK